jgi:creatinine amidohydrolase
MAIALIGLVLSLSGALIAAGRDEPSLNRDRQASARSRIHALDELAWPRIDAFDRQRTMFILPVGIVEEHGPHLPVGADTLAVVHEATVAARRVRAALPEWNIVMMPALDYGQGGANEIAGRLVHPGTYGIRQSTLRALVADIGAQIAQNGFTWIFVVNGHGGPVHNIAINEACDFVSETFGVTMVHLTALFRADEAIQAEGKKMRARHFTASELASIGLDVHAGVSETAGMLAVRPDLVGSSYRTLPSRAGASLAELREIASSPDWQGYLSAPAMANLRYGRAVEEWWIQGFTDLMLRAVRGENLLKQPRVPESLPDDPGIAQALEKALDNERAFERKLEDWLARRTKR